MIPLVTAAASVVVGVALLVSAAQASATPSREIHAVELNHRSLADHDYVIREITIAPGGSTGWHWHDGELIGVVEQGTLTHNAADCAVDGVYGSGDSVVEPAGADHVHIGRNLGSVPTVLEVIYVQPPGKPAAEDAPNPGCDFD